MNTNNHPRSIYYAHSKLIFGTYREARELEFLKGKYPKANIICPHTTMGEINDFTDYLHVVDCCCEIIVSEIDGYVSKGLLSETARAFSNDTPVYVLRERDDEFYLLKVSGLQIIHPNDWKNKCGRLIVNQ